MIIWVGWLEFLARTSSVSSSSRRRRVTRVVVVVVVDDDETHERMTQSNWMPTTPFIQTDFLLCTKGWQVPLHMS
jgi:hypothetical protein